MPRRAHVAVDKSGIPARKKILETFFLTEEIRSIRTNSFQDLLDEQG
jgi:hypothetical protein